MCVWGGGVGVGVSVGVGVCAFLSMQSPRIGLILVLEGVVFHYISFKCLFGTVTIYSDILFYHFCLKMQIEN